MTKNMLYAALCFAGILFFASVAESNETVKPPNIVVILADDLGWGDVGWHGSEIKTPHLDRLAESGMKLEQFYVQPVCSPTRAALMTGRYPMRYGLQVGVIRPSNEFGLPIDERTLADALREAGYFTAVCGKWHLGERRPEYLPLKRGFDHHYGMYLGATDYYTHERDGGLDWHRNGKPVREEGYTTDLIADESVRLIRDHNTSKPLFLYVPFNAVHGPFQPPKEDRLCEPYKHMKTPRNNYAAMTASMDENIGRILSAIKEKGIEDNTIIFFSSDNGGPNPKQITSNGPLRGGKFKLYEGGVRVAACIAWAGKIKPKSVSMQPMHIVDLYPTLLGLAGGSLKQEKPIDGLDMKEALLNDKKIDREILLNANVFTGALRQGDWKIVVNGQVGSNDLLGPNKRIENQKPEDLRIEVFNVKDDPYEKNDLSQSNPEKRDTLWNRYQWYAKQAVPHLSVPDNKDFEAPEVWGKGEEMEGARGEGREAREEERGLNTACASSSLASYPSPLIPHPSPNIVIILGDDSSYHDYGCWGNKEVRTPNVDRLAEQGIRLTQFYSPAAVCSPLRQALLTGMFCVRNGAYPNHSQVYPDVKTLPTHLKTLGYRSICVGKTHFGPKGNFPFDEMIGMIGEKRPRNNGTANLAALERFMTKNPKQPFCAYIASNEPHGPWNRGDASVYDTKTLKLPPYLVDTPAMRLALKNYYAEINDLDAQVGLVLSLLEKTGHAEDTIVFFFSEQGNGVPFAKWSMYNAGIRTAAVVRWPGKIKPGSESKTLMQYVDLLPTLIDIAGGDPTAYETGQPDADGNKGFDGKSFKESLLGKDVKIRDYAFSQHTSRGIINGPPAYASRMVTDGRWKLIWNIHHDKEFKNATLNSVFYKSWLAKAEGGDVFAKQQTERFVKRSEWELYNTQTDPWEMTNLADKPEHAETKGELQTILKQWMRQQGDQGDATEMQALDRQADGAED